MLLTLGIYKQVYDCHLYDGVLQSIEIADMQHSTERCISFLVLVQRNSTVCNNVTI